jgi:hypothetical protein
MSPVQIGTTALQLQFAEGPRERGRDDTMQREGIVGPPAGGSKSREILVPPDYFL